MATGQGTGTPAADPGAITLTSLRDRVETTLQDATNLTWTTDDLDEALRQALHRYSKVQPDTTITPLVLTVAGREIDISTITSYMAIKRVWWDYDDSDPAHPPNWRNFELWPGNVLYINDSCEPSVGDTVRIWYTHLQTLYGLDSATATSLPTDDTTTLVIGAAGIAATSRARELAEQLSVDGWVHKRLNTWGKEHLAQFEAALAFLAQQQAARASGIAPGPPLDRWDDAEGWS